MPDPPATDPHIPDPVEQYLDAVLLRANLPRRRARIVRSELKDHLTALLEASNLSNPSEIQAMLENQFGHPARIGDSLKPTYPRKSRLRRLLVRCAVAAALLFGVRATLAEVFHAVTDAAAPQVPAGSRCLVFKHPASYTPGDVVAFHPGPDNRTWLGVVKSVDPSSGSVTVSRKNRPDMTLSPRQLVGRVIANTR